MNYILFDESRRKNLLPLTFMRPVADIRFGILTIREKWERYLNTTTSTLAEDYLTEKFPIRKEKENIIINGAICPNPALIAEINQLEPGNALIKGDTIIALCMTEEDFMQSNAVQEIETDVEFLDILNTWDIYANNADAIIDDYKMITQGRKSAPIPEHCIAFGKENIFIEEGVEIYASTLNGTTGPIYIGKGAVVMEGCHLRGPLALCEKSVVKMSAKIYGGTTIGPHSKVGGEINNSVIFGYSNKAHDGFMGHSVIAEWCNIGADTNTSNLKNTYDNVKLWSYADETFIDTNQQFCGTIMGDHSKCGINTMFNTGTVVGVSANIFGAGFPEKFIPSFCWGGAEGMTTYSFDRAMETAGRMMARRNKELSPAERNMYQYIFNKTTSQRDLFAK